MSSSSNSSWLTPPPPSPSPPQPPPSALDNAEAKISPSILFIVAILAIVFFVCGLLHLMVRHLLRLRRRRRAREDAESVTAFQGQLQQLFHLHDAGVDQAFIDALPVFLYRNVVGGSGGGDKGEGKDPFDCAVCLSEFADHDRLRLLPSCGHAFHVACIDVWLRSSATCPLCRTKLSAHHLAAAAAADAPSSAGQDAEEQRQKQQQDQEAPDEAAASSVVLPVRLGRFTSADGDGEAEESTGDSSRIDARRCYSMGSYHYVLADEHLLVSVHMRHGGNNASGAGTACVAAGTTAASSGGGGPQQQGKKVFARGDSFSVSKIWQWRGSKRLPVSLCADDGLPWAPAAKDPAGTTHARQQQRSDT